MIPDRFDATARAILDAIHRNPGIAGEPDLHTRIAEALRDADKAGAIRALEMAAEECERLWKEAPNDRESGFRQNYLSHGCLASSKEIRKLADELRGGKR